MTSLLLVSVLCLLFIDRPVSFISVTVSLWAIPEKKQAGGWGVEDMEFQGVIEEIASGFSRGQFKTTWNFQG